MRPPSNAYRVVSPYQPFAPESNHHLELGLFDWPKALVYLETLVRESCGVDTVALTDLDTWLPIPAFRDPTEEPHLMLWLLEVARAYLASDHFDRDTVWCCPDVLVFQDLAPWFTHDLGMIFRDGEKHRERPILNSVQWWRHRARAGLMALYDEAIALARTLPPETIRWGADTVPFERLLAPMSLTPRRRNDLGIRYIEVGEVLESFSQRAHDHLHVGAWMTKPNKALLDFRGRRKRDLFAYVDTLHRQEVHA